MERMFPVEKDYYVTEYFSDGEDRGSNSSDDEVQIQMAKMAGIERCLPYSERDSDRKGAGVNPIKGVPEFESDMDEELDSALAESKKSWFPGKSVGEQGGPSCSNEGSLPRKGILKKRKQKSDKTGIPKGNLEGQVDEELGLFDKADSDDDAQTEMTLEEKNEELFYDPDQDQDNQNWVDSHRKDVLKPPKTSLKPLPNSDAVLNCPACMSLLCMDCQRHEIYKTQYRAMFVHNCNVNESETLFLPSGPSKKARKKQLKKANEEKNQARNSVNEGNENVEISDRQIPTDSDPADLFKPVNCAVCNSEVGVYDSYEVYHFFNVLSSYT